jgi:hypothetical protein
VPPCAPLTEEGSPTTSIDRSPINDDADVDATTDNIPTEPDNFPEDTQDFEEGGEGDDDFGDFDDGFQQSEEQAESTFDSPQNQTPVPAPPQAPPGLVSAYMSPHPNHITLPCGSMFW